MTLASPRRSNRQLGAGLGALLALMLVAAALVAGCGGSGKAATTARGRTVQVLATVRRSNLIDTVIGRVQLTSIKGKAKGTVQVTGSSASQVAAGQSVTLAFFRRPSGAGQGNGSGQSQGAQSGAPSVGQSGGPSVGQSGGPSVGQSGGQGFFGQGMGGQGVFGQGGAFRGKTAQGTVTAVQQGSTGVVTATIAIAKLPAGITAKFTGVAQIQVRVLASNVLIVPTVAIKGSGGDATVQVLVSGKATTRKVVVGRHTQTESEIVSGLSAGDNVVYTRTFSGQFPGGRSGQSGGQGFPGQNGAQSGGAASVPGS